MKEQQSRPLVPNTSTVLKVEYECFWGQRVFKYLCSKEYLIRPDWVELWLLISTARGGRYWIVFSNPHFVSVSIPPTPSQARDCRDNLKMCEIETDHLLPALIAGIIHTLMGISKTKGGGGGRYHKYWQAQLKLWFSTILLIIRYLDKYTNFWVSPHPHIPTYPLQSPSSTHHKVPPNQQSKQSALWLVDLPLELYRVYHGVTNHP